MRLEAVTAWFFKSWMIAGVDYSWEFELEALQTAADSAQQVFGDQWPDWFQISLVQGPAAQILISESARANLLIVGTRDHSRLVRCLLGSISAACRKRARCPVLVMHDKSLEATGRNTLSA
jgi:nucleotide-binding universal stress UspA family protein